MAKERGDVIIGEAKIKFGMEYRDLNNDQGLCITLWGMLMGRRSSYYGSTVSTTRPLSLWSREAATSGS